MGKLLRYKEIHEEGIEFSWCQSILHALLGTGKRGQWRWRGHCDSLFLTYLGPLFEDFHGPPKCILSQITSKETGSKHARKAIASDDEMEDAEEPFFSKFFGIFRIYYTILETIKRVILGIIAGAYSSRRANKKPILIMLCITSFQLFFLVLKRPFIKKKVQFVELISVTMELCMFVMCIILFKDMLEAQKQMMGYFMLALFMLQFGVQMINEWYALYRQVLRLSPDEDSFIWGMKTVIIGLLLIFFPPNMLAGLDDRLSSDKGEGESRSSRSSSRQKNNSGGNERSWIRQLREIAKESFSRSDSKEPSSSHQKGRSGSSSISTSTEFRAKTKALQKDLQSVFSSK